MRLAALLLLASLSGCAAGQPVSGPELPSLLYAKPKPLPGPPLFPPEAAPGAADAGR